MREHQVRPDPARQLGLRVEAGDDGHLHLRVQRAQHRHRAQPEGAGAVDEDPSRRRRRMARDRVQRHRERVGEHGELIGHRVGHAEQHAVVGRHQLGVSAGHVGRYAGVDAGLDIPVGEAPAQAVVAVFACGTGRFDPTRTARQPRVQHHPLPDLQARAPWVPSRPRRRPPRGPSPEGTSRRRPSRCRCRPRRSRAGSAWSPTRRCRSGAAG